MKRARDWSGSVSVGPRRYWLGLVLGTLALGLVLVGGRAQGAASSPITVTKTASAIQVASGGQLTYTIVVKNTGGAAISNVVMTDQVNGIGVVQLPPALPQFTITSTKGSCTQGGANGNLITCTAGNMAGNESWTVTIGGQVTAGAGTTLNNTATVTGTKSATTFTTPSNSTSVLVTQGAGGGFPDLTINKTGPTSVTVGAPLSYTLTVNNIGNANTANVKVVDTLPAGVTLNGSTPFSTTSLFSCSSAGVPITVTCTGGAVNAGQNATITINGFAPGVDGAITNTAVVDPDNTIAEANDLNNTSATVNTSVGGTPPAPLLGITLSDTPDPVNPGQLLTYKILVTNNASGNNATANYVSVVDSTQGLDASSITASQTVVNGQLAKTDGCVVNAPQVKCTVKALASTGTISITIIGKVVQSAGASLFDTATVNGNVKNTGVTNTASEATTVRPYYDLNITKSDSPDPVCAASWPAGASHLANAPFGATPATGAPTPLVQPATCLGGLTYTLVVGNSGISAAAGVVVRDPLPVGAILDSYSTDGGFICGADGAQVVTCTGGTIPAASTKTIRLLVAAPPYVASISNTATVDPNNAIFEADETNNTATQATSVVTGVDLVVWKGDDGNKHEDPPGGAPPFSDGFDPIATSGTDTYTIIVDNVGAQDTSGIKVVDTLPAGTKFLSVTPDANHSFTCAHDGSATGGIVRCVGGQLKGTESEFYNAPGAPFSAPGDDFATIKIKIFATPFVQPAMRNVVEVDPDHTIPEFNELNNLFTDDTVVGVGNADKGAFNQLALMKTQTSPSGNVAQSGVVTYDLQVDNYGTDPVSSVVVKDFLPAGSRFISVADTNIASAARFFCTHDGSATGGVISCTGGDFSGSINVIPGVATTRHIKVRIFAPTTVGTYTNNATVDPDNVVAEGNEFDNDSSVDTTVAPCNNQSECTAGNAFYELTIAKTQVKPSNPGNHVARNGIITYNLKVSNLGSDPVHSVVATDRLPAGFRFIDAKDSAGVADPNAFTCTGPDGSGVVTCSGGSLSGTVLPLGSAPTFRTIAIRVFAPDTPGTYTNNAFVDPANSVPEGNEFNNQDSLDTIVENRGPGAYIDLAIEKTRVFPPTATDPTVSPGGGIQYNLHVSNSGEGDAFNVAVSDALPQHVTFHNARDAANTAGAFSCAFADGTLSCTGGTIPAGGSRDILVNVTVASSIDQFALEQNDVHILITNQAIVDPANAILEGDETNNTSFVDTTIKPPLDLALEKQGPGSATANENTTYTITVHNVTTVGAGATAHNIVVVDPLPTGLIPLNAAATGDFHCDLQENPVNKVTCTGDLQAGTDATITITAFVTLQSGELDNEACVDPADTIAEKDETNNCKTTFGTVVPPAPDLQIVKEADTNSVTAGEKLNYTLTVSNQGTGPTSAPVVVTDPVPTGLTVDGVVTPDGWDCSATAGNNVSCTTPSMNKGDSAQIKIQTTVGSSLTQPFTNKADVSIDPSESLTTNNTASLKTQLGAASGIDLEAVSLTGTPDPVNHDDLLTFTGIVTNNGTSDSGSAKVQLVLPAAGVSNRAVIATGGFSCGPDPADVSGKTFNCSVDLAAGASTTITATMKVDPLPLLLASLTTTMTADPADTVTESDETNNDKSATVTISGTVCAGASPCVDLVSDLMGPPVLALIASPGPIGIYTATVTNAGTSQVPDTTAWNVHFMLSGPGLITSVVPLGSGVSCTPAAVIADCSNTAGTADAMDLGAGASVQFQVTVLAIGPGPLLLETDADAPLGVVTELSDSNNTAFLATVVNP
jgi:uncharacterized repeat protein (TIGR01451 family)